MYGKLAWTESMTKCPNNYIWNTHTLTSLNGAAVGDGKLQLCVAGISTSLYRDLRVTVDYVQNGNGWFLLFQS